MAFLKALAPVKKLLSRKRMSSAVPLPDEELLKRKKRQPGSRPTQSASTILSGTDYGIGG